MSRASLIEQLYVKRKSALEFNYDALWAPPIRSIFTQQDINELYRIATSLRYNGNIEKKYELIDAIMQSKGFRRAHCGTNRVVYNFLEIPTFVAKVALDKVGLTDSPAEFKNQEFFKPFCCKIFEVDPTGVLAFVERVNPISSIEEFLSVADDVFNMMVTKIIGKYVVDDLGSEKYMNYGLRYNSNGHTFGPVIIDFPYAYELDGGKLICRKPINTAIGTIPCGGEIDYDIGFNHLICTKCGRRYTAMDLKKNNKNIVVMYGDDNKGDIQMRARIISNGKVIMDSGRSSSNYITKEEYECRSINLEDGEQLVSKVKIIKSKPITEIRKDYYTQLQIEQYNRMQEQGFFKENQTINSSVVKNTYDNTESQNDKPKARISTINNVVINNTDDMTAETYIDKNASTITTNIVDSSNSIEEVIVEEVTSQIIDSDNTTEVSENIIEDSHIEETVEIYIDNESTDTNVVEDNKSEDINDSSDEKVENIDNSSDKEVEDDVKVFTPTESPNLNYDKESGKDKMKQHNTQDKDMSNYYNDPELYSKYSYDRNKRAERFNNKKKHKSGKNNKGFNDYNDMNDY